MKRYLALDIGTRRTGVAFADSETLIPLPLDTLTHTSFEELAEKVQNILQSRSINHLVIGLPLLPSGESGSQAAIVTSFLPLLALPEEQVTLLDERYSSGDKKSSDHDDNARAACAILNVFLDRMGRTIVP